MLSDSWELLACFMLHMAESIWRKDRTALIIHQNYDGEKERIEKSKSSDKQGSLLSPDSRICTNTRRSTTFSSVKGASVAHSSGCNAGQVPATRGGSWGPSPRKCSMFTHAVSSSCLSVTTVVVTIFEPPALEHVHWDFLTWSFSYCGTHRSHSTGGEMLHIGLFIRPDHKDVIKGGRVTYDTADLWTPYRCWSPSNRN